MDLIKKLEEYRTQERSLSWEGTFADYFEIVKANPRVAQLGHARVFDMIMSAGVEAGKAGAPLHLIPNELRNDFMREYGIYIEGDLCPHCRFELDNTYGGHIERVPVRRVVFSEKKRIGIGTFTPSDPKSQDISELTGSIDLSTIGEYGSESDPRAYRFDGELNIANRGVMEFIEMLKVDERFLYSLLSLYQVQSVKKG